MNELNNNNDDDKTVSVLRSRRAWCQRQLEGRRKSYLLRWWPWIRQLSSLHWDRLLWLSASLYTGSLQHQQHDDNNY